MIVGASPFVGVRHHSQGRVSVCLCPAVWLKMFQLSLGVAGQNRHRMTSVLGTWGGP